MIGDSPGARAAKLLTWISTQIKGNPELAAECYRTGHELAAFEELRAALRDRDRCARCGRTIVNASRGRRRIYCRECRPTSIRAAGREMHEKSDRERE